MAISEYTRERLWDYTRDSLIEDDLALVAAAAPAQFKPNPCSSSIYCKLPPDMTINEAARVWIDLLRWLPGYTRENGLAPSSDKASIYINYRAPYCTKHGATTAVMISLHIPETGVCRRVVVGTRMETETVETTPAVPAVEDSEEVEVPVYAIICDGDEVAL